MTCIVYGVVHEAEAFDDGAGGRGGVVPVAGHVVFGLFDVAGDGVVGGFALFVGWRDVDGVVVDYDGVDG